jgi:glycosyltransferase involved in cell wall biosynthesis
MADLMFLTPLLPYPTGTGSAMRASVALDVLAERHRVFVVNSGIWGPSPLFDEGWVRKRAAGYTSFPSKPDAVAIDELARERFPGAKFDGLYVFRLCMAPIALQVLARLGAAARVSVLDLDDDELGRAQRIHSLRETSGDRVRAAAEGAEIQRLQIYYKMFLPRFQITLLAASADRDALAARYPGLKFAHLCNVVREPECVERDPEPHRLLFVGSLGYLPNEDAVVYFCEAVLPLLRASGVVPFVRIVGPGAGPRVVATARAREVQVAGSVADLAPEYARATAAIVPLRAGSGTRIKILEAISHRCPVVSTSIGAEGLSLKHEEHILIADTPVEFAACCVRLMEDAALRSRLVENAANWLSGEHSMEHARAALHPLYAIVG